MPLRSLFAAFSAVVLLGAATASADPVADFYKGKTVTFLHAGGEGGSFALYTRVIARHIGAYIPGKPDVIVQFRPGAGGLVAINYMYNAGPKDGTLIAMPTPGIEAQPFLLPDQVKFDLNKIQWLGNMTQLQSFITVWHAAPARTWQDLKARELIFGATGKGSEPYVVPQMMNDILGTRIKVVAGYPGIQDVNLAMEKGEVHGRGGGWTATMKPEFFAPEMKVRFLVQIGDAKLDRIWDGGPSLADVPLLADLAAKPEDKQLLGLLNRVLSRPLAVAPEVPADRVAALRRAYDEVMKDKDFLAEMARVKLDIVRPMNGAQVAAFVRRMTDLPDAVKARYKAIVLEK